MISCKGCYPIILWGEARKCISKRNSGMLMCMVNSSTCSFQYLLDVCMSRLCGIVAMMLLPRSRRLRLRSCDCSKKLVDNLGARFRPYLLNLLNLAICFLVCFLLGGFVAWAVLLGGQQCSPPYDVRHWEIDGSLYPNHVRTSFSNFWNSCSFCCRYSSISFCASLRASFTRFVRSGRS